MPLVSIVMSVYNDGQYVKDAVESILTQGFTDFDFVIVDDGCTDNTRAIIASYNDARIRLVINENNLGLAPSLNKAIRLSGAKYIARQDADDISLPDRLFRQVDYLESHPEVAMLGSAATVISHNGERRSAWPVMSEDIDLKWAMLFRNPFIHSSVMMRRSVVEQAGYYTEEPETAKAFVEDYDLWRRINRISRSANLCAPLLQFRLNPTSASIRTRDRQLEQAARISLSNVAWVMNRDTLSSVERQAFEDANDLFLSAASHLPQLPPTRLRAAVAFLDDLQKAFYTRYRFTRSQVARHRRHWHWIWGKHLLALSARTSASITTRLTFATLGSRHFVRLASSLALGVPRPQREFPPSVPVTPG